MSLRGLTSRRVMIVGASAVAAVAAFSGCSFQGSSSDTADKEAGKQLFVQSCGSCHALDDAGTTGRIGPNLDDAFRAARQAGIPESQFEGVTKRWIEISQAPMPRNLVVGQDADDVSVYVADVAGEGDGVSGARAALPQAPQSPAIGTENGLRRSRFGPLVNDVEGQVPATPPDSPSEGESDEGGE